MTAIQRTLFVISIGILMLFQPVFADDVVDTAWVRIYAGTGGGPDVPSAMEIDDAGNVYVTGTSWGDGTKTDYLTVKYSPGGDLMWDRRYDGPASDNDSVFALQVDGDGNVYVTGGSVDAPGSEDITTLKYSPDGTLLWERRYSQSLTGTNRGYALQIDADASLHIAGFGHRSLTAHEDFVTIKYDSDGTLLWARTFNGLADNLDVAKDLGLDGAGNVYVTGQSRNGLEFQQEDYVTLKYSSDGTLQWDRRYSYPNISFDCPTALVLGPEENVYITGRLDAMTGSAFQTIKYNPDGDLLWAWVFEKSQNVFTEPIALAVDANGSALVAGRNWHDGFAHDYILVECDSAGVFQNEEGYNGPANLGDEARDLAVDAQGNTYVTGSSYGIGTGFDYATVKFNADGDTIWVKRFDGPVSSDDYALKITLDDAGNIYVAGRSTGDYMTIKYSPCTCVCLHQGDGDADNFITALDLAMIIDVLFAGGDEVKDICCPTARFDLDCDGFTTALDLSVIIDHLFAGGDAPCDPCVP